MTKRATLAAARSSENRTGKDLAPMVPAATVTVPQACRLCPLCRCHFDCRPEAAEAVSVDG